ncbi:hypothetical protein LCR01_00620 [Companilactobacillus crustorum]|uniref:Uncharacterized protein n=3 Tax=Companilactobacillus TaxID=2767879 RepID=A0A837RJQ5_9LACO|nr:hypothetical protein [Companilactobacillus crustorum]HCD07863.1 hypothetical protein [Lactobacillus sp.]APU71002.1 hypothetical protein BI355_0679 [Companilactobacillus crustorum]KRK44318.1 hypothetical protein FD26_GL000675 [Companilactobacillus crustorum JCM 15951]KRO21663.1 hypothetical protein IV63_GL000752 [Companilactobacillus crustorum]GEO75619.1 hypothetical protein LCR01_00620 [Companilactobacillus crustorum]
MSLEKVNLWVQIVSTVATSAGVLISLHYSRTKSETKYSFFCKLINQEKRILSQYDYRKIEFGAISANEFNIGIQQVGIEFISNPFKKEVIYRDSKSFDENSGEIAKAREIYSNKSNPYFGLKEFNDKWDKKMFVRPYIIDMSGRIKKMNWFKMLKHRFRVKDFAYKGIPYSYFDLL